MTFTPPQNIAERDHKKKTIFVAGTIEMGNSEDWQSKVIHLIDEDRFVIFNPRRPDWDSSWSQEFTNPQFNGQVNWELNALEKSDIILMYFAPSSKSPISLLELGLFAHTGKLRVVCSEGFWKKGNIDIVCERYNIPMFNTLEDVINNIHL